MFKLLQQSPLSARIGIGIVILNILVAIFAPLIAPYGETSVVGDVWESFSAKFYFGTDHIGRDLFTRMVFGARNTIALAFITTILSFSFGSFLGFIAAGIRGIYIPNVMAPAFSLTIPPQSESGGCRPSPKKLREAIKRNTKQNLRPNSAMSGGMALGKISCRMIHQSPSPLSLAASTNSITSMSMATALDNL